MSHARVRGADSSSTGEDAVSFDKYELGRVRAVGLSPYDIKVLTVLMETGGEFPFYIERVDPKDQALHIAGMHSLALRNLIDIDQTRSTASRWIVRLTDNGRAVCTQLEKMNAKPKVEIEMHGDVPVLIKP